MEKSAPTCKTAAVWLALCALCVGLALFTAGCPTEPPCNTNADCDDGLFCNGAETCVDGVCVDGTSPCDEGVTCDEDADACVIEGCQSDTDCEEGEFCDTQTGECLPNVNLYGVVALDRNEDGGNWDAIHPLHTNCTACHHEEPAAGFQSCRTCHADDPNGVNSFKDVAHDQNESGDGCRMCHADDFADCAYCHIALSD
jgi:hypothetical protein